MEAVCIVGVGLIGGSFALALRAAGFDGRIVGVSSPATLQAALDRGVIDAGVTLEDAVPTADLVYLAQPIQRILELIPALGALVKPGALVTDAGSTKAQIVAAAKGKMRHAQFLGGHPMAGKEARGVESAEPSLFMGRTYVLTPVRSSDLETQAAQEFLFWVCKIGATPVTVDPETHDRIVAHTSHLPQLASTALAAMLEEKLTSGSDLAVKGPALADLTRLALSPFEVWRDILETNRENVGQALDHYITRLTALREELSTPAGPAASFESGARFARRVRE
jgi:prephenate dehydrogenase